MRIRAALPTWDCCPTCCPAMSPLTDAQAREKFGKLVGREAPGQARTGRARNARRRGQRKSARALRRRRKPGENIRRRRQTSASANSICWSCRICSSPKPRKLADIVLPAAVRLRKKRHDDQHRRRSATRAQGRRRDGHAHGLRHPAHPFAPTRAARARAGHPPAHARSCLRRNSASGAGYDLAHGHPAARRSRANFAGLRPPMATRTSTSRVGSIFSSHDTLFTSGSLSRYCTMIRSLPEAAEEVEVEARP